MSNMKDYKNAMDRINAPDTIEQALFADAENNGTRRIEKHSAWQKPVAAAAVAAVVGLNVFAVMKLRQDAPTLKPGMEGSSQVTELSEHPDLPDLSAWGIDISEFTFTGIDTVEAAGEWLYAGDKPQHIYRRWENADGDAIDFDEHGRFVNYIRKKAVGDETIADPDDILQNVKKYADAVLPESTVVNDSMFNTQTVDQALSDGDALAYEYDRDFTLPDGIAGRLNTTLSINGTIWESHITYHAPLELSVPYSAYETEAIRLISEKYGVKVTADDLQMELEEIGGKIYGILYNSNTLIVCPSEENGNVITAKEPDFSAVSASTFTLNSTCVQPLTGIWSYESEIPTETWTLYRSETEEEVYLDEAGRIVRYIATNIPASSEANDEQNILKAEQLIANLTGCVKTELFMNVSGNYCFFALNEKDEIFAEAQAEYMQDGRLRLLMIDYTDWDGTAVTDEQAAAFDAEAQRLVAADKYTTSMGDHLNANYCWYVTCGGKVYAKYVDKRDENGARYFAGTPLIVRVENPIDRFAEALSIYTNDFKKDNAPYTGGEYGCVHDQQLSGYWLYQTERPAEDWITYINSEGAMIVTDQNGNIRRFFTPQVPGDPDEILTAEEIARREEMLTRSSNTEAQRILAAAFPHTTWSIKPEDANIWDMDATLYQMIYTRTENGAETTDKAYLYFDQYGNLSALTCNMAVGAQVPESAVAQFDAEAARILSEKFNLGADSIISKYFDVFGGKTYGFYQFETGVGETTLIVDLEQAGAALAE